MNKFVGCYKDVVALKKSGTSESDIISTAKDIFYQDMVWFSMGKGSCFPWWESWF